MDKPSPPHSSIERAPGPRPWAAWRFSIRELLLLTTLIATLLALGITLAQGRPRRYMQSAVYQDIASSRPLHAAIQAVGARSGNSHGLGSGDGRCYQHLTNTYLYVPVGKRDALIRAYRAEIEGQITKSGCQVIGPYEGTTRGRMYHFVLNYQDRNAFGTVVARVEDLNDETAVIFIFVTER